MISRIRDSYEWCLGPLLLGVALAGCGSESTPLSSAGPTGQELLRREPDGILEERGRLVPSADEQWGRYGRTGWSLRTAERQGTPFVWTRVHDVRLVIPALEPVDRDLELVMWSPAGLKKGPETVSVVLNGLPLGAVELSQQPERYSIPAPAVAWRHGDNELELNLDTTRWAQEGVWHGLALAEVHFGENVAPRLGEAVVLENSTGVRYHVEQVRPSRLLLSGRASGDGFALVHLGTLDPAKGISTIDRAAPLRVAAVDGVVQAALSLPPPGAEVLQVEVVWEGEPPASTLTLDSVRVEEREPSPRPSILFISVDTLAARNMSLYGYERETTPEIEAFAKKAVTFELCRSNASWTLPSFMSVMTGLFAYSHKRAAPEKATGQKTEVWENWYLASNRWTLAEALHSAGYRTAGFVDNLWITENARFTQGFEVYDAEAGQIPMENPEGGIRHVVPKALDWIDGLQADEPFFLFVHCFDVHGPYVPSEPWRGSLRDDALFDPSVEAPAGALVNSFHGIPEYVARGEVPTGDIPAQLPTAPIHAAYDEGIAEVDSVLGDFFDALEERGLLEDTIVVLTADHGESMTSHDYYFGHGLLYEDILHVPLVVHLPGGAQGGTRVDQSVQLVDLYPTLLDLAGLQYDRDYLHGRSLRTALETGEIAPYGTYSEGGIMLQSCVEVDGWKLIEYFPSEQTRPATLLTNPHLRRSWLEEKAPEVLTMGGMVTASVLSRLQETYGREYIQELHRELAGTQRELYYLPDDPLEENDLSEQEPQRVERLGQLLHAARERREVARANAEAEFDEMQFSEDERAMLMELGYMDAEGSADAEQVPAPSGEEQP